MVPVARPTTPIPVLAGQVMVATDNQRLACEVASAVALVVYDPHHHVAAVAHVLLPSAEGSLSSAMPAKHADRAVPAAIEAALCREAERWRLQAMIVGGACDPRRPDAGQRTVDALRAALAGHRLEIQRQEVGGNSVRRVVFDPQWSELSVEVIGRL